MSLQTRISDLATRIGTEFKTVRTEIANAGGGDLLSSNNLSDVANAATARTNLSVYSTTEVDTEITNAAALLLTIANNLSDLNDVATARTNLGVYSSSEVDTEISNSAGTLLAIANNLSDVANAATARTNLGVYSSAEVDSAISAATAALVDGAPGLLDTFDEIATALGDDPSFATTITTALTNRIRYDAAQSLTAPQLAQAQSNMNVVDAADIGDTNTNYVTTFEAALL
jgi:hypothetical protein